MTVRSEKSPAPRLRGPAAWALCLLAGCSEADMVVQPKYKPLQPSTFFADGQSSRPVEPGTVARGLSLDPTPLVRGQPLAAPDAAGRKVRVNPVFDTGESGGTLAAVLPIRGFDPGDNLDPAEAREARRAALLRGQERYNIYCSPCHSRVGDGNGMIVQRGFTRPPSFHQNRLREAPAGHFFHAITNGYGVMYSYASRISPADRWAIVAYVRALQMSQPAVPDDPPRGARTAQAGEGTAR